MRLDTPSYRGRSELGQDLCLPSPAPLRRPLNGRSSHGATLVWFADMPAYGGSSDIAYIYFWQVRWMQALAPVGANCSEQHGNSMEAS